MLRATLGPPLHDAASMRATDHAAIAEHGVVALDLMRRAGAAVAEIVRIRYPSASRVVCVCGGGANGGDGIVAAQVLRAAGIDASCLVVASRPYDGVALQVCDEAVRDGVPISRVGAIGDGLADADVVVDGLLGTGFTGAVRGPVAAAIAAIARAGVPVVAVDLPSGVDASTGAVGAVAVRADLTVTLHAPKIGLLVMPGRELAGQVVVAPIGIPRTAEQAAPAVLATIAAIESVPGRERGGSKYDAGSVLVIGGSAGLTGAVVLAACAALRGGAGIVVAAVPASLNGICESLMVEPMTLPCPDEGGALTEEAGAAIAERAARVGAVVLGPGIGRAPRTAALVRHLVAAIDVPLVLDADGLNAIGSELSLLAGRRAPIVVTPHAGEAARLLGTSRSAVDAARLASARAIAAGCNAICVLKGADTLIAAADGRLAVRDGDEPALATAGAGDVLAGTIAALLARGADPFAAAAAGAVAHLAAARAAIRHHPRRCLIAGDLVDHLALR